MKWRHGSSRSVLLIGRYAIKFPTFQTWRTFLYGLLANGTEVQFHTMQHPLLAPILWRSWLDWIIVMPRAEVKAYDAPDRFEYIEEFWRIAEHDPHTEMLRNIVENKVCSVGKINGAIVAIDYGS